MCQYHWPGNVRELRNVIERGMILADQEFITPKHLPFEIRQSIREEKEDLNKDLNELDDLSLEGAEKAHLSRVLSRFDWNKSKASKVLGISRATLRAKIRQYQLSKN